MSWAWIWFLILVCVLISDVRGYFRASKYEKIQNSYFRAMAAVAFYKKDDRVARKVAEMYVRNIERTMPYQYYNFVVNNMLTYYHLSPVISGDDMISDDKYKAQFHALCGRMAQEMRAASSRIEHMGEE